MVSPWKLMFRTLGLLAALGATGFYAFAAKPELRVVAQVDAATREGVSQSLAGVESLVAQAAAQGDRAQVEVVFTGRALKHVRAAGRLYPQIARLQTDGVVLALGTDSLRGQRLDERQFPAGFVVVPSAAYEIARLEKRRFSYLRP